MKSVELRRFKESSTMIRRRARPLVRWTVVILLGCLILSFVRVFLFTSRHVHTGDAAAAALRHEFLVSTADDHFSNVASKHAAREAEVLEAGTSNTPLPDIEAARISKLLVGRGDSGATRDDESKVVYADSGANHNGESKGAHADSGANYDGESRIVHTNSGANHVGESRIVHVDSGANHVNESKVVHAQSGDAVQPRLPDSGWGVVSSDEWEDPKMMQVVSFVDKAVDPDESRMSLDQAQTSDHWPVFSKKFFPGGAIPKSPFVSKFTIKWRYDSSSLLLRPDVLGHPPKLITWMIPPRNVPQLPEPVVLRVCPEMPCRLTTNPSLQRQSSALLWNAQLMDVPPPARSHPDQVFVFHNNEPQKPDWIHTPSFRMPEWKSNINWTFTYRNDSDVRAFYGHVVKNPNPPKKNYRAIAAKKTKLAVWMSSHCSTESLRETFVYNLLQHIPVYVFGTCGPHKCLRGSDDTCFAMFNEKYKFLLAFENAFCEDYISEKFFRYLEADMVVVARGSNEYRYHAPPGTYIDANDFRSAEDLAKYLVFLDTHPEEYIKLLKRKDQYKALFEDWPIRNEEGEVFFMQYHFEAVGYCELCRRLWDLDTYRKNVPDIVQWFDKGNCYNPPDL